MNMLYRSLIRDLITAAKQNDRAQVELLLLQGVQADASYELGGTTAFLAAVEAGHLEMVRWLIGKVHHPDLPNIDRSFTPLSQVIHELGADPPSEIRERWLAMMECLLEAGADPNAGFTEQKPIVLSSCYGLKDIETILLRYVK